MFGATLITPRQAPSWLASTPDPPSMAHQPLRVVLLGGFGVAIGGGPLESVGTPRLQSLLAYLLLHRQTRQPRQHLAFLLWPDSSENQARTNLRSLLHRLRRVFPHAQRSLGPPST